MIILLILLYLASKEWLLPPPSYLRDLIYKCSLSKGPILWGMVDVQEFLRVTVSDMIIFSLLSVEHIFHHFLHRFSCYWLLFGNFLNLLEKNQESIPQVLKQVVNLSCYACFFQIPGITALLLRPRRYCGRDVLIRNLQKFTKKCKCNFMAAIEEPQ